MFSQSRKNDFILLSLQYDIKAVNVESSLKSSCKKWHPVYIYEKAYFLRSISMFDQHYEITLANLETNNWIDRIWSTKESPKF